MQSRSAAKDARRRGHNRAKRARKHRQRLARRNAEIRERFRLKPDSEYLKMADAALARNLAHDFVWWRRLLRALRRLWPL